MRAIVHNAAGDLTWGERPTPEPGPGEVRVRVAYAGVNRADLMQRAGHYPPPPGASPILGLEVCGTVDAIGPGAEATMGATVCALLAGGGYAEAVTVPVEHTLPVPDGLSLEQAGALMETLCAAWMALRYEGNLAAGERALIHAGASGVGTMAIQMVKALGAEPFATAGGSAKVERCLALGATGAADRHAGPWVDAVAAWAPEGSTWSSTRLAQTTWQTTNGCSR